VPDLPLLQRLKQRKIVQHGLAYLAGAFVVFQGVEVMAEPWGISPGVQRGIHIVLLIGLLITLVFAWYHGEKGRQRVSGPELLMVAALLVVAGVALSTLGAEEEGSAPDEAVASAIEEDDRPRIAVLPCTNMSADPAEEYLSSSLHDEILLKLQGISSLVSIGRASVEWYRANPAPLTQVAQELRVGYVGECSVQKNEEQIRLIFQLLDGRTGGQVWAKDYDRDITPGNLFDIQKNIALQIAQAMRAVLTPEEEARISAVPTENSEAYQEFLRGKLQFNKRTEEGFQRAIEHLERSVALDPGFAEAHATLSLCYSWLPLYSRKSSWAQVAHLAEKSAEAAIRLDPGLAEAHTSLGVVRMIRDDVVGAEEEFISSITANPSYAEAYSQLSHLLSFVGRHEEAIAAGRTALGLDPFSFGANLSLGYRLMWSRQYDAATRQFKHLVALYDDVPLGWLSLAFSFSVGDSIDSARTAFLRWGELSGIDPSKTGPLASLASGYRREAVRGTLPSEFDSISGLSLYFRSRLVVLVGDEEKALDLLDRDGIEVWPGAWPLAMDPILDPLRDHPRFQALLERYGADGEH
jgi:TolB-like protein